MILTMHGPRLSLSERIAEGTIRAITDRAATLGALIDVRSWSVEGATLDRKLIARDELEALLNKAFSRGEITYPEAHALLAKVRNQIPFG